jgi:heme oxygenase (biliverdin-IX-beta and delta-forming)
MREPRSGSLASREHSDLTVQPVTGAPPMLARLRAATGALHHQLEQTLDVIGELSDASSRPGMIRRYAALHIPADPALAPHLAGMADLDFHARSRAAALAPFASAALPPFPRPQDAAEALGMLYVLEGSILGGRLILHSLADRGIEDPALAFLDPYGAATGARWRHFLAVLTSEVGDSPRRIDAACNGADRGFRHAGRILSGDIS